ncbi:tyrosine-type recombinase/integrase [Microbacteriaceae bacterium K1510]|jgi:site-specific recombinase XerD|uniref:tyrosine-type recombinase/integrase n=1 Tax=Microbacteriaceae TaxID=85023 RepID=UPI000E5AD7DD|nr:MULTISPECIES: tyrosine-type recombinase/integrase [Microbacteriaceae]MBN9608129.1 tyrosine-type recombinase/integrase [Actinomycetota bacterium]MCA9767408.1 tyrosine-type recombinase/integrase [Gemmatimonadota bacterium]MCK9913919.1 tyrosine-type recombinase/integrase [Microbacteriaceae bacterium K1510]MBN9191873.1 tyrosine-type recombinase/integrase [Microbacterium sp.]RGE18799.1 site-specific integrase [Leucobacter sp. wl10]
MKLAVVRSIGSARGFRDEQDVADFEQELVDQFALAMAAAGLTDGHIQSSRAAVFEFRQSLAAPLWAAAPDDADRFLAGLRRAGLAVSTRAGKAKTLAQFYDFAIARYRADVHALTGFVLEQPIDEYNRQSNNSLGKIRVPPSDAEVDHLFAGWRSSLSSARKFLPAARDYFAASLWRRLGLRINESAKLDIRDWRPDLGEFGKLHVRFGKGSRGRGVKPRLVPAINGADRLIDWWLAEVRHLFGPDWDNPDAPMIPSERFDQDLGRCSRASDDVLRQGLKAQTVVFLPAWVGRMTPHVLRHYCASSLYGAGMDLKAIQEILGHEWLSTTTRYIHVSSDHVEQAWLTANRRLETRFGGRV